MDYDLIFMLAISISLSAAAARSFSVFVLAPLAMLSSLVAAGFSIEGDHPTTWVIQACAFGVVANALGYFAGSLIQAGAARLFPNTVGLPRALAWTSPPRRGRSLMHARQS